MKKTLLTFVLVSSLLMSCNSEAVSEEEPVLREPDSTQIISMPANPTNPYDAAGRASIEIFDAYLLMNTENDTTITKIRQRINEISLANADLMYLNDGYPTTDISAEEIEQIVKNPVAKLDAIISASHLTSTAKIELKNFIDTFQLLENEEYDVIYKYITDYEIAVIENTQLNNFDKRVLLVTSALLRHWSYKNRKREDKDWSKSTGNLVGAVKGVIESPYTAVTTSLTTSIVINKNVISR